MEYIYNIDLFAVKFINSNTVYYFNNSSNEFAQIVNDFKNASGIDFIAREQTPLKFKKLSKKLAIQLIGYNTENEQALKRLNFIK